MSHNQSRAEKSDGHPRKSGGRSGYNRGFSGSGGGGKAGGAGGVAPLHQHSSSSDQQSLSSNRSLKKSGNGQGGQPRVNHASPVSEAYVPSSAVQNGAHGQHPSHGSSTASMTGGPKPGDTQAHRTSWAIPKAPASQSAAGKSDAAAPNTPRKGDETMQFSLQFGSISPGIVNGLQIPARTSSAPPNLDEQKRDQARHDSFRAVPTQPIPSGPKQQPQPARKDVVGVNQFNSGESHPPAQVKREVHQQIPTAPVAPLPKSSALPLTGISMAMPFQPGISMAMPFQQPHIPMQFGGPGPHQMPMTMPIGNAPQAPQQMYVHNLQSHALQSQAVIHQGQGLGFGHQISHQLSPQLGSLGIGIAAAQFAQQHQPGKFGGPRKTTVKITHPETHEELRLDNRDSYSDDGSSGQRPSNNVMPQSQPISAFPPSHYFPQPQTSSYNPPPIFFPTSTSVTTGSQPPRYGYTVGQGGQTISFMNQSLVNQISGSKSQPPLHGPSELVKLEASIVTAPAAPSQGTLKPTYVTIGPKIGGAPVTISMPGSKVEEPKLLKPPGEATIVHQHNKDREVSAGSSVQQPDMSAQASDATPLSASGIHPGAATSVVSKGGSVPEVSSAPVIQHAESGTVVVGADAKKMEPVKRSDSLKDHQKKSSKNDLRSSQQQKQTELSDSASVPMQKLSSAKIPKDDIVEDVNGVQLTECIEHFYHESLKADISTTTSSLASSDPEHSVRTEAKSGVVVESKAIPAVSGSSGVIMNDPVPQDIPPSCYDSIVIATIDEVVPIKGKTLSKVRSRSAMEVECVEKTLKGSHHGMSDTSKVSNAKVHPVPTITESPNDGKPDVLVRQENSGANNVEKLIDRCIHGSELASADVERKLDAIATSSEPKKDACNDEDTPSSPYHPKNAPETTFIYDIGSTAPAASAPDAIAADTPITADRTNKPEAFIMEVTKDSSAHSVTSGPKDNFALESTKVKSTTTKKKRRERLSKADAAGNSDIYNAYKGPDEKHQINSTSENADRIDGKNVNADDPDKNVVAVEEDVQSKAEVDDWEDAAEVSTPKLENGNDLNYEDRDDGGSEATCTKKYSRDFLLTFSAQCTDLPGGFVTGSDIVDALLSMPLGSAHVFERDSFPSPGKIMDRSPGVSRSDRRGIGMTNDDRWIRQPGPLHDIRTDSGQNFRTGQGANYGVLRNPRGQPPNQFYPILPGPMQPLVPPGGPLRNSSDADRWRSQNNSRGLMPPPPPPLQVMHKAERKYEIGKVSDEEQGKQRQLKAILNKLTPQNFEKLFQQVKDVNIDNTITLSGVISQIFDKALMEPTFCEMYANFCYHLSGELPDFNENDEKITFKRLLLNKCQEEFERGEREQAETNRIEEEGEIKLSDGEREEKRIKARRRMLGNIRLIGELYKKKMLTDRIMHECIHKLLGQYQNPDEEDLESLCKLMSTIGEQIDNAKAKELMDAYFDVMLKLSTNQKLSSRIRFLLRDVIDLRKSRWRQRRKVEGPKKIEEVHRDAAQERQSQSNRLTRGPSMNSASRRGPPGDYGARGSSVLPSPNSQMGGIRGLPTQVRGVGLQDARLEERHPIENRTLSFPLNQRHIDDSSITLGPQGGLARGMSIRGQPSISNNVTLAETPMGVGDRRMTSGLNGYSSTPDRITPNPREDVHLRYSLDRLSERSIDQPSPHDRNVYVGGQEPRISDQLFDRVTSSSVSAGRTQGSLIGGSSTSSEAKPLSDEILREKSILAIREFYSAKDEEEVALCVKELNSPNFYPTMVSLWVTDSFERKDVERDLLAKLLVNLCKSRDSLLSQVQLTQGFESVLSSLEDAVNDAPRAAEFLGHIFVKVILENVVPLGQVGKLIHEGGEEPGRLLEIGLASDVLGSILEIIKAEEGESALKEIIVSSNLRLKDFRPPQHVKSTKLEAFL